MFFRMVYKSGQIFLPFCHNTRVWQMDGRTDRQTDRRTDRILIARPRLHSVQLTLIGSPLRAFQKPSEKSPQNVSVEWICTNLEPMRLLHPRQR